MYKFKAVLKTRTPRACHLIGFWIKKLFGIPHILDYRHEWKNNTYSPSYATKLYKLWSLSLERYVVNHADDIVTVSNYRAKLFTS